LTQSQIGIVNGGLEFVSGESEKDECDNFGDELVQPLVPKWYDLLEKEANDTREVDIAYDDDVEVFEYAEFAKIGGHLAVGF
jgi:hypothetical protein